MAIQLIHCILCHDYVNSFKTLAAMHLELAFSRTDSSILFYTCKGSSKVHHAPCVYNQPLTQAQRLFDCVDGYGASCSRNGAFCRSGCSELSNSIEYRVQTLKNQMCRYDAVRHIDSLKIYSRRHSILNYAIIYDIINDIIELSKIDMPQKSRKSMSNKSQSSHQWPTNPPFCL